MKNDYKIPYGKQCITDEDILAVTNALKSELITQGNSVPEFEEKLAKYHDCKYAVVFGNGTQALHGAYYAFGITEGDEIISSPITFVASTNAGLYEGAIPKFVDMDIDTYCIDINKIDSAITDKTKVITPVSYAGYPVDIKKIRDVIGNRDIKILHDAAHAIGARREGESISKYADMTMISFHPVKHITTGEGGVILTDNKEYYDKLMLFRSHGITRDRSIMRKDDGPWYYEMLELGNNYRMTDICASLGVSQLKRIDENLLCRQKIAKRYFDELKDIEEITLPYNEFSLENLETLPESFHSYHLYPILLKDEETRLAFFNYMREHNIFVQVHYYPVHLQPYYMDNFGFKNGDFPVAENFYKREVSIPMFMTLSIDEQNYVIKTIKDFFN